MGSSLTPAPRARSRRNARLWAIAGTAVALTALVLACVDGVTPNCPPDASVCSPTEGALPSDAATTDATDAPIDTGSVPHDAAGDAPTDAGHDGDSGDGG
jgi:hypothetical protein